MPRTPAPAQVMRRATTTHNPNIGNAPGVPALLKGGLMLRLQGGVASHTTPGLRGDAGKSHYWPVTGKRLELLKILRNYSKIYKNITKYMHTKIMYFNVFPCPSISMYFTQPPFPPASLLLLPSLRNTIRRPLGLMPGQGSSKSSSLLSAPQALFSPSAAEHI